MWSDSAVRILTTIITPDQGRATILGIDVTANPQAVRERIGLAGQYAAVDENLTARENLRMVGQLTHLAKKTVRRRSDELIERFDLVDAADQTVRTYSGGMRRRLDLAAALIGGPTAKPVIQSIAWSVGLIAVFAPLAVRRYRKAG
jgi:ABC-2 type transport system ATP-binding protein